MDNGFLNSTTMAFWQLLIYGYIFMTFTQHLGVRAENCTDPCDRPMFCEEGEMIANPDNCESYFWCVYAQWVETECSTTGPQLYFDNVDCVCTWDTAASCALPCPTTTPRPTEPPGTCDNIPDPCEEGALYPDQADCRYFYECINGAIGPRTECNASLDLSYSECAQNLPCVFDIGLEVCINPDPEFDCYYRCVTSGATEMEVTSELSTEATDWTTEESGSTEVTSAAVSTEETPLETTIVIKTTTLLVGDDNTGAGAGAIAGVILVVVAVTAGAAGFLLYRKRRAAPQAKDASSVGSTDSEMCETTNDKEKLVMSRHTGQSNMIWRSAAGATKGVEAQDGSVQKTSNEDNQQFWSSKYNETAMPNPLYGT